MNLRPSGQPRSFLPHAGGFALALLLVFCYLLWRNYGAYPLIFADEWLYSSQSRLLPFRDASLPSYLYLAVFHVTNACGSGFLECARAFNAAFVVLAAPFLYLIARTVSGKRSAAAVALLATLGGINSFTGYFMPEMMYYFGFCVLSWAALTRAALPAWRYGALTGALLGAMSVVKVHALFLLPALLAFMLYLCWHEARRLRLARLALMSGSAVLALLLVKTALSFAIAGPEGASLIGSFYGAHVKNTATTGHVLGQLAAPFLLSLRGHAMALVLLLAVPLAGLLRHRLGGAAEAGITDHAPRAALEVYALLMLGAALGLTVMYTATLQDLGVTEVMRLHQRYYDFVFPLLLIAAIAPLSSSEPRGLRLSTVLPGALLAVALVLSFLALPSYPVSVTDAPELAAMAGNSTTLRWLTGLELAVLLVWMYHRRLAAQLLLFVLVPLNVLVSETNLVHLMTTMRQPRAADSAGAAAHARIPAGERGSLMVAGEGANLQRALFQVDDAGTGMLNMVPGAPFERSHVPMRRKWLLVMGDHALPPDFKPELATDQYRLYHLNIPYTSSFTINPARPLEQGRLVNSDGLAGGESWGAWSNAGQVKLQFAAPLPARLMLFMTARAFGPNVGRDFVISVGAQRQTFRLSAADEEVNFQFDTDGSERQITIDVPQPTSPAELKQGADDRKLGIAMLALEVGRRAP